MKRDCWLSQYEIPGQCRATEKLILSVKLTNRETCSDCWETQTKLILEKWTTRVGLSRFEVRVNQNSSLKVKTLKHNEWGSIFQKQVRCIAYHLTSQASHICFADISRNKILTGSNEKWSSFKSHQIWQFHKSKIHEWRRGRWIFIHRHNGLQDKR